MHDTFKSLYMIELVESAKLFTHLEFGGKADGKSDGDARRTAKALMTRGSARVFLAERAKFAEKLKADGFTKPVLAKISLDVEDRQALKTIESQPRDKYQSRLTFSPANWSQELKPAAADAPAVDLTAQRRPKVSADASPVIAHCAFVFNA